MLAPLPAHAVDDCNTSAQQLYDAIVADPLTETGTPIYQTSPPDCGNAHQASPGLSAFPTNGGSFALMTTGDALLADDADTSNFSGTNLNGGNIQGANDFDVTTLQFDILATNPAATCLAIDFMFFSEEYPESIGPASERNDGLVIEVAPTTQGAPSWSTEADGDVTNPQNNIARDEAGNPVNVKQAGATMSSSAAIGTTYDGATQRRTAVKTITPGTHRVFVSIFDQLDHGRDSAVFLDNARFVGGTCTAAAQSPTADFGDAPDANYATLLASAAPAGDQGQPRNGARHTIDHPLTDGPVLGNDETSPTNDVDSDPDGQPNAEATGDDVENDDEAGVSFPNLATGETANITVTSSKAGANLYAWIDWNGDGDFRDAGERIRDNEQMALGGNTEAVPIPDDAKLGFTYARFRLTNIDPAGGQAGELDPDGGAPDGEVEDYRIRILGRDFGDAPDPYPTLAVDDGARHILGSALWLGPAVDVDIDGFPHINALGDDTEDEAPPVGLPEDDEDGVDFGGNEDDPPFFVTGEQTPVTVNATAPGFLDVWVDTNGGGWNNTTDHVVTDAPLVAGNNTINIPIPDTAPTGTSFARFRVAEQPTQVTEPTGRAENGEVEDYEIEIGNRDFGDAPDSYKTIESSDGARHVIDGPALGTNVDHDPDGVPSDHATGDDVDSDGDDEDGVTFPGLIATGGESTVNVTATQNGQLDAWMDFNSDGDFTDAGEQIFTNRFVSSDGPNALTYDVPADAAQGETFARFRISTNGGLSPTGRAADGEVEDYEVEIFGRDFGDLPDDPYPTLESGNGARHVLADENVFMGASVDNDGVGQPNATATGDDTDTDGDDENGVTFPGQLLAGDTGQATIIASGSGFVDAFMDFNHDGDLTDAGEQILTDVAVVAGANGPTFAIPANAEPGQTAARFRISKTSGGVTGPTGQSPDGEVEDYFATVLGRDFGDAPDPSYPTLEVSNGARHIIGGVRLGSGVDSDGQGQPSPNAQGDDADSDGDDEDGVVFSTPARTGGTNQVTVTASSAGKLDAWGDFNNNGSWADAGEQIFASRDVASGANNLTYSVPNGAAGGQTFFRFRISSAGGLDPTGQASDGEVEDHRIFIEQPCGATLFASVKLRRDMNCDGTALIVGPGANDIVINLNGHTIRGNATGIGIDNSAGADRVVIKNGSISGFDTGVVHTSCARCKLSRLRISGAAGNGIEATGSGLRLFKVRAVDNGENGFLLTGNAKIDRSSFLLNFFDGLHHVSGRARIERSKFNNNFDEGAHFEAATRGKLLTSRALDNSGLGFFAEPGSTIKGEDNIARGNNSGGPQCSPARRLDCARR